VVHACHPNYGKKHKEEDHIPDLSGDKVTLYLKNNQSKNSWNMVQLLECLPTKHKALSSNSSTTKKKTLTK
jgi:hypothetical protein